MNHISFTDRAPIVIQGALDSELDLLLNTFTLLQTRKVGSFEFHECIYKNRPVVISKTKIGEICSAIATTLAIQTYHPTLILNQGTAGALVDWLNTGDIIALLKEKGLDPTGKPIEEVSLHTMEKALEVIPLLKHS